jgi:RNA polymerase primary sigma factor
MIVNVARFPGAIVACRAWLVKLIQKEELGLMASNDEKDVSLMALNQYMRFVKWSPRLTPEQEEQLFQCVLRGRQERLKPFPDEAVLQEAKQARDRLVEGYQALVICIGKTYRRLCTSMEQLDVIQEGNIGLLYALENHQPGEDHSLRVYACICIRRSIVDAWRKCDRHIRLPRHARKAVAQMLDEKRQLEEYLGCEPTPQQLAQRMGVRVERVYDLLEWSSFRCESLEQLLEEDESEDEIELVDRVLLAAGRYSAEKGIYEQVVRQAMQRLSPRQQEVIALRYGFDDGGSRRTQDEVGQILGMRQGNVSTVESRAKAILRAALSGAFSEEHEVVA